MKRLKFTCGALVACSLLCGSLASCDRSDAPAPDAVAIPRANTVLSACKLPKLPDGVSGVRCWAGGIFAKYVNIKFTASPDQASDFLHKANAACYVEFQIEGGTSRVLATHSLGGTLGDNDEPDLYMLTPQVGIFSRPWFRSVYDIRHGWYYHHFYHDDAPVSYYLFCDLDRRQFYLYWTYS